MKSILFLFSLFLLVACSQNAAPVTLYGVQPGAGSAGVHTVSRGDTLNSIADRYNMRFADITILNDLAPPYRIKVGQRLELPAPKTYRVRPGDTLYFLSYMFEVDVEDTAAINGIDDPLNLRTGQVLEMPALSRQAAIVPSSKPARSTAQKPQRKPQASPQQEPEKQDNKRIAKIHVDTPKRSSNKFLKPVEGRVISGYGPKANGLRNDGINIAASRGTSVGAAENGVVVYAGNGLRGSGNLVLVRHEDRWMTAYAHLDQIKVKSGQTLKRGQNLGTVGSTGAVRTPQLHFEVRRGTKALNPKPYLDG